MQAGEKNIREENNYSEKDSSYNKQNNHTDEEYIEKNSHRKDQLVGAELIDGSGAKSRDVQSNDKVAEKKPDKPVIDESEEWVKEYKERTGEGPSFF